MNEVTAYQAFTETSLTHLKATEAYKAIPLWLDLAQRQLDLCDKEGNAAFPQDEISAAYQELARFHVGHTVKIAYLAGITDLAPQFTLSKVPFQIAVMRYFECLIELHRALVRLANNNPALSQNTVFVWIQSSLKDALSYFGKRFAYLDNNESNDRRLLLCVPFIYAECKGIRFNEIEFTQIIHNATAFKNFLLKFSATLEPSVKDESQTSGSIIEDETNATKANYEPCED